MKALTNAELRKLKGLAQHLEPVLRIGKAGLSDALVASAELALAQHELIKVRFSNFKDETNELSRVLAERTGSTLIARVGHVAVFYKEDPKRTTQKVLTEPPATGRRDAGPVPE